MLKVIIPRAQCGMAGFESPAAEYKQSGLSLTELLIQHPTATYICYAEGDSMIGDGIYSGDLLIVSTEVKVKNGDVIVANLNGDFICKKIDLKRHRLLSSNQEFSTYQIGDGEDFQCEGVVISSVRLHRELNKPIM